MEPFDALVMIGRRKYIRFIWKDKQKFQQWSYIWTVASRKYQGCKIQCFPKLWKRFNFERLYVHSILTLIFNRPKLKCFLWNIIAARCVNARWRGLVLKRCMPGMLKPSTNIFPWKLQHNVFMFHFISIFPTSPPLTFPQTSLWKEIGCQSASPAGKILCSTQILNTLQLQIVP